MKLNFIGTMLRFQKCLQLRFSKKKTSLRMGYEKDPSNLASLKLMTSPQNCADA